jgi:hypothetical protein
MKKFAISLSVAALMLGVVVAGSFGGKSVASAQLPAVEAASVSTTVVATADVQQGDMEPTLVTVPAPTPSRRAR